MNNKDDFLFLCIANIMKISTPSRKERTKYFFQLKKILESVHISEFRCMYQEYIKNKMGIINSTSEWVFQKYCHDGHIKAMRFIHERGVNNTLFYCEGFNDMIDYLHGKIF